MIIKIINKIKSIINYQLMIILGNNEWVWSKYRIPTIKNINISDNYSFKNPFLIKKSYTYSLLNTNILLGKLLHENKPFTIVRLGDSEMMFLDGKMVGNIVRRSFLTDDISKFDLDFYKKKTIENDFICIHDNNDMRKLMPTLKFENQKKEISFENMYQLVSTKLLFYTLKGYKIGIIGATEKVDLIKKLIEYDEYKEYLGINSFVEFIGIPQKGASGDYNKTMKMIESQMTGEADIYLVGMSVAKLVILPNLRDKYKRSFIDIGVGIDAIAGIIPNTKSYFGNWINYRIKSYDYSKINFFRYQSDVKKKIHNIKYLENS